MFERAHARRAPGPDGRGVERERWRSRHGWNGGGDAGGTGRAKGDNADAAPDVGTAEAGAQSATNDAGGVDAPAPVDAPTDAVRKVTTSGDAATRDAAPPVDVATGPLSCTPGATRCYLTSVQRCNREGTA